MKTFLYKPPFGHADANIGNPPLLEVEALDDSGNEIQNFNYWHPLWAFQIREDGRGGLTILPNSEARIVTEFDPRIAETQISYIYSEEGEEVEKAMRSYQLIYGQLSAPSAKNSQMIVV